MAIEGLDEVFPEIGAEAPVAEPPQPEPAPEPEAEPAPEPEPTPEPQPEPQPVQTQPEHVVPLPKFLDTRDELKEERRRRQELEARLQAQSQARPDPFDDPDGFRAEFQAEVRKARTDMSWEMASQAYGVEATQTARDWALERAQREPAFMAALDAIMTTSSHPIAEIVRQHKQSLLVSEIGDNVDDWFTREAAKRGYVAATASPAVAPVPTVAASVQQAPKPAVPPRSLVDVPSQAPISHTAVGLTAGIEAVFPK